MSAAIDCRSLSKRYGRSDVYALEELTLQVQPGEVYGFLGPNGAGKSTTIRTLLNFIQPSAGSATILGLDIVEDSVAIKQEIGYLSGEFNLYRKQTGREFLDYMDSLRPARRRGRRQELVKTFQVDLRKRTGDLSKGNRQKLGLVQALMHEPKVLILDEPTSGLDPLMQAAFYAEIERAKQAGACVFLSSHDLSEVRKTCDRVGFIRQGRLVSEQTIADLQRNAAHRFDVTFQAAAPLAALKALKGVQVTPLNQRAVSLRLQGDLSPLLAVLSKHKVVSLDQHELDLEEEFLDLYRGDAT